MAKKQKRKPDLMGELRQEMAVMEQKWKRALADYQNLEKRSAQQRQAHVKVASLGLVDKLLPVLDDLERAAEHIKDDGLQMTLKQFHRVLESEGVIKIEAKGKEFDPEFMDCVEMVAGKKNEVVRVMQEGYMMGETVIRPAKVEVGVGTKELKN